MNNYTLLIQRLDVFIRKFYTNQLVRGLILFFASLLALYLVLSVSEYYLYFSSTVRTALVTLFLLIAAVSLIVWVLIPLFKTFRLGKVISHEKAAEIVGTHFPNVSDKLLNVLQLKNNQTDLGSAALIQASIDQKTSELVPIPYVNAINIAKNKKYLKYLLPPVLLIGFILLASPNIFKESAQRLIEPTKTFEKKAPFTFSVENKKLNVPQYDDFVLEAKVDGTAVPDKVMVNVNGQQYDMLKKDKTHFTYTFLKVPKDINFNLQAAGFSSQPYKIAVLMKPVINSFKVFVDYPDYTGHKDEVLDNMGDIVAPQGTQVRWAFNTAHTDNVLFSFGNGAAFPIAQQGNIFTHATKFMHDTTYNIMVRNNNIAKADSLHYTASIVPDQYPAINVNQYNDSLTEDYVLFTGEASDDYGVRNLNLVYTISKVDDNGKTIGGARNGVLPIAINGNTFTQFNHMLDIETLHLEPGTTLSYYFQVWDNDGVNGSKSAKSQEFKYSKPTYKQLDSLIEEKQEEISKDISSSSKASDKIEKQAKALQEKLLDKPQLDWEDKKQLQEVLKESKEMKENIEKMKEKFQKNNERSNEINEHSDAIKEKQEQLEKIMDEMLDDEMKKKLDRLQELMDKLSKEELFQKLEEIKQDQDLQQKDFERLKALMDQLEKDMRMEDLANKMRDLAKLQDKLQKQNEQNTKTNAEQKKDQDALNKEFDKAKEDLKEIEKLNDKTDSKVDMDKMKDAEKEAEENAKQSSDDLKDNKNSSAAKKQKKAKEKMEELSDMLKEAAEGGSADQLEIDVKATRQLLQNLIRLSFNQEDLMQDVKSTPANNPQYVGNIQIQQKLKDDSKMVADSLFALSKRIAQLSSVVNREIDGVNRNMGSAINNLEARFIGEATSKQQYVMTGVNNLALMLNELLQSLMEQQAKAQQSSKPGGGSCKKPGGKKSGSGAGMQLSDMITQQQKLGSAMQQLMAKKGQGKKPGEGEGKGKKPGEGEGEGEGKGKKPGSKGGEGKEGSNGSGGNGSGSGGESENNSGGDQQAKEIAQIAAQQAALRKQLNDINKQLLKEGKSLGPKMKEIQSEMDKNETDLVNKRITDELIRRQSTILSKLLETKDAIREQEQGEERQSNSAKELTRQVPQSLQQILKNKQSAIDYYKTVPPDLKPYYKQLVEEYFGNINGK